MPSNQNMLTVKEAAARLRVSRSTVYRWVDEGDLPVTRVKKPSPVKATRRRGGAIRIAESLVDSLIAESEAA